MDKVTTPKKIEVAAYSGYKANERPISFTVDNRKVEVRDIIDRWSDAEHDNFKVLADDGKIYLLRWQRTSDLWFLEKIIDRMEMP
ncbi:MAG: hypothetical protein ISS66_18120 [Desulfobacteraceae bacterium]|nr:hypothetical protein [Desulfobacteraceae bacterium]